VGYERASAPETHELETLYRGLLAKIRRDLGMPPAEQTGE